LNAGSSDEASGVSDDIAKSKNGQVVTAIALS
jgi:hypothetical protein